MKHILGKDGKYISTIEAAEIANVTRPTIVQWCKDFGIGKKVAGTWHVEKKKLFEVLEGDVYYGKKEESNKS